MRDAEGGGDGGCRRHGNRDLTTSRKADLTRPSKDEALTLHGTVYADAPRHSHRTSALLEMRPPQDAGGTRCPFHAGARLLRLSGIERQRSEREVRTRDLGLQ